MERVSEHAGALLELGDARARAGDFSSAERLLRAAERADPGEALTTYYLGLVHEAQGNYANALALYQNAPRPSPFEAQMDERAAWIQTWLTSGTAAPESAADLGPRRTRPVDAETAMAVLRERSIILPPTRDLVDSRLISVELNLGGLLGLGLGARDPAAEILPPSAGEEPLPEPPPPPGGN